MLSATQKGDPMACNEQDIVERLRMRAKIRRSIPREEPDRIADICEEAAAEIERLRKILHNTGVELEDIMECLDDPTKLNHE